MSRIEANVASQVGDLSRPRQSVSDQREQADAVRRRSISNPEKATEAPVRSDDVRSAVAELRQVIESASGRELAFNVYEETKDVFVEISDKGSGEVIKQIPAEEVLDLRSKIKEMVGMFVNEQA
ncbi:MAG: flagellar protein FlaG [Planctomycetota bacterium]